MLGHLRDDGFAHLSAHASSWNENHTLFDLDLATGRNRSGELSRKTGVDRPVDGVAVDDNGLLMHVCLTELVDDTPKLELLDVAIVSAAKEGDGVEMG